MCARGCACECRARVQKWVKSRGQPRGSISPRCANRDAPPLTILRTGSPREKATSRTRGTRGFARVVFPHPPRGTLRLASARLGGSFAMAKKAKKEKKDKKSKKCVPPTAPDRPPRLPGRSRRASRFRVRFRKPPPLTTTLPVSPFPRRTHKKKRSRREVSSSSSSSSSSSDTEDSEDARRRRAAKMVRAKVTRDPRSEIEARSIRFFFRRRRRLDVVSFDVAAPSFAYPLWTAPDDTRSTRSFPTPAGEEARRASETGRDRRVHRRREPLRRRQLDGALRVAQEDREVFDERGGCEGVGAQGEARRNSHSTLAPPSVDA